MVQKILMAFACVISSNVWAETWIQVGEDGYMVECPDVIEFKASTYLIFNDCYGEDPRRPVIEVGSYEIFRDKITLFQRHQSYEPVLGGSLEGRNYKIQKNKGRMKLINGEEEFHFREMVRAD